MKYYILDPHNRYNHGCVDYAIYRDNGDSTATCISTESCHSCWSVGHDDRHRYTYVGEVLSVNHLLQHPDLVLTEERG